MDVTCVVPANSPGGRVLIRNGYRYMQKSKSNRIWNTNSYTGLINRSPASDQTNNEALLNLFQQAIERNDVEHYDHG